MFTLIILLVLFFFVLRCGLGLIFLPFSFMGWLFRPWHRHHGPMGPGFGPGPMGGPGRHDFGGPRGGGFGGPGHGPGPMGW